MPVIYWLWKVLLAECGINKKLVSCEFAKFRLREPSLDSILSNTLFYFPSIQFHIQDVSKMSQQKLRQSGSSIRFVFGCHRTFPEFTSSEILAEWEKKEIVMGCGGDRMIRQNLWYGFESFLKLNERRLESAKEVLKYLLENFVRDGAGPILDPNEINRTAKSRDIIEFRFIDRYCRCVPTVK